MKTNALVEALEAVERIQGRTDLLWKEEDDGDPNRYFNRNLSDPDLDDAISKMDDIIDAFSDPGYQLMVCSWFMDNGYRVWAGEEDSFGWLSGCIQKITGTHDGPILIFG